MKLIWRPDALHDLDDIWDYSLNQFGKVQAVIYLETIHEKAAALTNGELSGTAEDKVQPGLRRQISRSHVIWFRVESDVLVVIRVLHQSRDAGWWMG